MKEKKINMKEMTDIIYSIISGIAGTVLVWYQIKNIETFVYLISAIAGILIAIVIYVIFEEDDLID